MNDLPFALNRDTAALKPALESRFQLVKYDPDIWGVQYQMLVPMGWTAETNFPTRIDAPLTPLPLGLFLPTDPDGSALISVSGCRMGMEVNLEDWIAHLLAQEDLVPGDGKYIKTPLGLCWDCGAASGSAPDRLFTRIMAWANSGNLYFVTGRCHESKWSGLKDSFLAAGVTFQLTAPEERAPDMLEGWSEWESEDSPRFGFAYPQSWRVEPVAGTSENVGAADLRLVDEGKQELLGYLRVKATDLKGAGAGDTGTEKLLDQAVRELQKAGIPVEKERFIKLKETPYADLKIGHEGTWVAAAEREGKKLELRIGIRRHKEMVFTMTMIGSSQAEQPLLWMRAKRAFEVVEGGGWKVGITVERGPN